MMMPSLETRQSKGAIYKISICAFSRLGGSPGVVVMFKRLWVQILEPDTGWTFVTLICCKKCIVCLKSPKINEKEAVDGPFKKEFINKFL